ncbi:MAG: HxsD-like protein [Candidatus Omnitrophota bacterium]
MSNNKPGTWRLLFDKRVYPLRAVKAAADDFSHLGRFAVRPVQGMIEVSAQVPADASPSLRAEFANYALGAVCQGR